MPAGRSPPIIPSLNPLTSGRIVGRKPPMPYKLAVQRRRERQRMAKGMKQIAAIGGAVAPPKRVDVLATRTAALSPPPARARERVEGIRQKRQQAAERETPQASSNAPEPSSIKPPRVETGRYVSLKNQQPG